MKKVYLVYKEYQSEHLIMDDVKIYEEKELAIKNANLLKEEMQNDSDWQIGDEYDQEVLTDSDNSILFTNINSGEEMYVNILTKNITDSDQISYITINCDGN